MLRVGSLLNHLPRPDVTWIEVASTMQLPGVHLIGLPGPEVGEAVDRVQAALLSSELQIPRRRWVVHLAPAGIRKSGTGMDAAIALGLLVAARARERRRAEGERTRGKKNRRDACGPEKRILAWAELGLDGSLKPAGCATRLAWAAFSARVCGVLVAREDASRVTLALEEISAAGCAGDALAVEPGGSRVNELRPYVLGASDLQEAWENIERLALAPNEVPARIRPSENAEPAGAEGADMTAREPFGSTIRNGGSGLLPLAPTLLRAVCAASAGSHHLLLLGPRGAGKSHALEWARELQPRPAARALVEHRLLEELVRPSAHSPAGHAGAPPEFLIRRVGTHAKPAALMGSYGQSGLRPGEYSLAHGGLLIADELPEWARDSRESLREPLERGRVTLTRAGGSIELAAGFRLAASGNLCPCGGWPGHCPTPERAPPCRCSPSQLRSYLMRLSGPILDRIDLTVTVLSSARELSGSPPFSAAAQNCEESRSRMVRRWGNPSGLIPPHDLETIVHDLGGWARLVEPRGSQATEAAPFSLRSRHKQARVALTLAALDGCDQPRPSHWKEAALLRSDPLLILDFEAERSR